MTTEDRPPRSKSKGSGTISVEKAEIASKERIEKMRLDRDREVATEAKDSRTIRVLGILVLALIVGLVAVVVLALGGSFQVEGGGVAVDVTSEEGGAEAE